MDSAGEITVHKFNRLMELIREEMCNILDNLSQEVNDDEILDIATIASNNDKEMGKLISNALAKVGRDGVVTVEESKSHLTELVIREGMEIHEGYISHIMANSENGKVEFSNPLVFLSNCSFKNFSDVLPMLEFAAQEKRPLLIMCKGMKGSALNNLLMNVVNKTIECAVILAPNFGDAQVDELGDVQSLIGGRIFNEDMKADPTDFNGIDDFGTCQSVTITKEKTTFVGAEGDVSSRVLALKETLENVTGHDAARLKRRISRLNGGVATIRIGAASSIEMREKKERLDDALNATKAALEEGIVVGGGLSLARAANILKSSFIFNTDLSWFVDALHEPIRTLISNSNATVSLDNLSPSENIGFNALIGDVCDLTSFGVYDPVKVTKNSFLAALSIANLFYSTDVAVLLEE
jgi:chaperonin GroEL